MPIDLTPQQIVALDELALPATLEALDALRTQPERAPPLSHRVRALYKMLWVSNPTFKQSMEAGYKEKSPNGSLTHDSVLAADAIRRLAATTSGYEDIAEMQNVVVHRALGAVRAQFNLTRKANRARAEAVLRAVAAE